MTALPSRAVFTLPEVAGVLRVTSETIRRKIVAGELGALEIGGSKRKQYRITASDLSAWLGPARAAQLFGIGAGLRAVEEAFAAHPAEVVEAAIAEAVQAVKVKRTAPDGELQPTPTGEEIRQRFGRR